MVHADKNTNIYLLAFKLFYFVGSKPFHQWVKLFFISVHKLNITQAVSIELIIVKKHTEKFQTSLFYSLKVFSYKLQMFSSKSSNIIPITESWNLLDSQKNSESSKCKLKYFLPFFYAVQFF